jgi:hypothetical protein
MANTQIPSLPPFFNMAYTDEKGQLTVNAQLYNDLTYQILSQVVEYFNTGLQLPRKTTAEITVYRDDQNIPIGTLWYNTDINKLQFKSLQAIIMPPTPGAIETVTST